MDVSLLVMLLGIYFVGTAGCFLFFCYLLCPTSDDLQDEETSETALSILCLVAFVCFPASYICLIFFLGTYPRLSLLCLARSSPPGAPTIQGIRERVPQHSKRMLTWLPTYLSSTFSPPRCLGSLSLLARLWRPETDEQDIPTPERQQ